MFPEATRVNLFLVYLIFHGIGAMLLSLFSFNLGRILNEFRTTQILHFYTLHTLYKKCFKLFLHNKSVTTVQRTAVSYYSTVFLENLENFFMVLFSLRNKTFMVITRFCDLKD